MAEQSSHIPHDHMNTIYPWTELYDHHHTVSVFNLWSRHVDSEIDSYENEEDIQRLVAFAHPDEFGAYAALAALNVIENIGEQAESIESTLQEIPEEAPPVLPGVVSTNLLLACYPVSSIPVMKIAIAMNRKIPWRIDSKSSLKLTESCFIPISYKGLGSEDRN